MFTNLINAIATMLTEGKLGYSADAPVSEVGELMYTATQTYYTGLITDVVTVAGFGLFIMGIAAIGYLFKKDYKKNENTKGYLNA